MNVKFPYREHGITLSIPDSFEVFHPAVRTPMIGTYTAIIKNLLRPLGYKNTLFDMAKKCNSACLVVDAYCPPVINRQILDPIIKTLHAAGMSHDDIIILVAAEYPSEFSADQIQTMFDEVFLAEYNVQVHKVLSYTKHELVGKTSDDIPIYLDRRLKDADIKIITGSIYPHYLFGYSGAPTLFTLGLSGPETIQSIYNLAPIEQLQEFSLLDQQSSFYKHMYEILRMIKLDFIVNFSIDSELRIIDIFSGKPERVIKETVRKLNSADYGTIPSKADIIVSCAGGTHFDPSWYHNLMGLCFSHSFLQPNGVIIFITSLFEQFSAKQLGNVKNKEDLIDLFALQNIITGTVQKVFSCINDSTIIFVSPQLNEKNLKTKDRDIYFCSSIDTALSFARQYSKKQPRTLLLPDGLLSFVSLQS